MGYREVPGPFGEFWVGEDAGRGGEGGEGGEGEDRGEDVGGGQGEDGAGRYDSIVSVEMIEAVGKDFLATYFRTVDRLLKKNGGIAVFQCITMPEGRQAAYEWREE